MQGLRAILCFLVALAMAGCDASRAERSDNRAAVVESRVIALEAQHAAINSQNKVLEARLGALEARLDAQNSKAEPAPKARDEYIMWQSFQYRGEYLRSPPKPKPLFAYEGDAVCWEAVRSNVEKFKGDPDTGSYVQEAPGGVDIVSLTCLPKGVDPR